MQDEAERVLTSQKLSMRVEITVMGQLFNEPKQEQFHEYMARPRRKSAFQ